MSVFGCFCKSPNMLKDKQTNKYPFDSLAAQSITLPHASDPFLQELTSSFQPVLSEMNKTLGDTKEWNGVTELWNHRSICLNLIIRIAGKSTHQKNLEDQPYSLLKNKVLYSACQSNWTQPNQFGSLFQCKMGISIQEINGDRQLLSSLKLRGTPKEHSQGVIYQKFSLVKILFKMCGQVLWKYRYFWRSFFLNLEQFV